MDAAKKAKIREVLVRLYEKGKERGKAEDVIPPTYLAENEASPINEALGDIETILDGREFRQL
jgi:hypothetical protein